MAKALLLWYCEPIYPRFHLTDISVALRRAPVSGLTSSGSGHISLYYTIHSILLQASKVSVHIVGYFLNSFI